MLDYDHTAGHSTVLGAITLGAVMVEKHFTNDNFKEGPDHKFSMNPTSWKEMILRSRELEQSQECVKKIEKNETQTVILQKTIRAKNNISKGQTITKSNIISLRPCPKNGIEPFEEKNTRKKIKKNIVKGDLIKWEDLKS